MAIETFFNAAEGSGSLWTIHNLSAYTTASTKRNIAPPKWATIAKFYLNWTAKAGTSPLVDWTLNDVDPVDKETVTPLEGWNGITQLTSEDLITVAVGPHRGVNDDTGVDYHIAAPLPPILQSVLTLDRTTGDETYTLTLAVVWR